MELAFFHNIISPFLRVNSCEKCLFFLHTRLQNCSLNWFLQVREKPVFRCFIEIQTSLKERTERDSNVLRH